MNTERELTLPMGKAGAAGVQPVEKRDCYLLSSAQKRLFTLQLLDPQSTVYNISRFIPLPDNLPEDAIRDALEQIVARHESLRTSFFVVDEVPVQRVHDTAAWELEPLPDDDGQAPPGELEIFQWFSRPFDLFRAPLIRFGVTPTVNGNRYLLLDMHHIIGDGVTTRIIERELLALCRDDSLPPLTIQYKDFVSWQEKRKQEDAYRIHLQYWLEQFVGGIPSLELPADFIRPPIRRFSGGEVDFQLNGDLLRRLEDLAAHTGSTLFMVLLATLNTLLARLGGAHDIVVGTPVTGREYVDLSPVAGMFVNTLPLRNLPAMDRRFDAFLLEVRDRTIESFAHREAHFDDLLERLDVPRDVSRNPVFDVTLTVDAGDAACAAPSPAGRDPWNLFKASKRNSRFDMSWTFVSQDEGMVGIVEYYDLLFSRETVRQFIAYFLNLAEAVGRSPSLTLGDIDFIPSQEKTVILEQFNESYGEYPLHRPIPAFVRQQAQRRPHCVIAADDGSEGQNRQLTFAEFYRGACSLAARLRQLGAKKETIVALLPERSIETFLSILGTLEAGCAYVPLDNDAPSDRNLFVMNDCRSSILIASEAGDRNIGVIRRQLPGLTVMNDAFHPDAVEPWADAGEDATAEDLAYVIYTSGTTGKPKGVMVEHRSIVNLVFGLYDSVYRRYDSQLRLALLSPFMFDASAQQLFISLFFAHTLHVVPNAYRSDGLALVRYFNRHCIDVSDGTPVHVSLLADAAARGFVPVAVKCYLVGGDVMPKMHATHLLEACRALGRDPVVINVYGPTECTVNCTLFPMTVEAFPSFERIPIGKPLNNYRVYILDSQLCPVPIGVVGELYIGGAGVARGYLNQSEATDRKFLADPFAPGGRMYRSGDLGRFLPDGDIDYLGRIDGQVKLRGYRIELEEIETCLRRHPAVGDAVAALKTDHRGDRYLCAYLTAKSAGGLDCEEVRIFLESQLPFYMVPAYFSVISAIPVYGNGRADHQALPRPELSLPDYVSPVGELERQLTAVWSEALEMECDRVSATANFFRLGGHSLLATALAARVQRRFRVRLPLVEVFRHPTIRSMADYIAGQTQSAPIQPPPGVVLLREDSLARPHIFLIHDESGGVDGYAGLYNHWRFPATGWGITASPRERMTQLPLDIKAIAASYIRRIDALELPVPYNLVGWSSGGIIAFEMALQLQSRPEGCGLVVLVDAPGPLAEGEADRTDLPPEKGTFERTSEGARLVYTPDRLLEAQLHLINARDSEVDPSGRWQAYCKLPLRQTVIAGDFVSAMAAPAVDVVVQALQTILQNECQ